MVWSRLTSRCWWLDVSWLIGESIPSSPRTRSFIMCETIRASPVARKCQESTERALKAILRRLLPIWTELSRNSLLAGTVGLVLGYSIARWWWWWRGAPAGYSSQGCPMKARPMLSLVRKSHGRKKTTSHFEVSEATSMPRIVVPNQVLIRVQAVSLINADIGLASKWFDGCRDMVGCVEELGHQVHHLSLGQQVWTVLETSMNSIAAFEVLPASKVCPIPSSLDYTSACTLPLVGLITFRDLGILGKAQIHPNRIPANTLKSVFVDDATTSLGGFAVQLLQTWGVGRVVTCVPYRAVPLVKHLGVDLVIPFMPDRLDTEEHCAAELLGEPPFDLVLRTSDLLAPDFCAKYTKTEGARQVGLVVSSGDKAELNNSLLSALLWPFRGRSRVVDVLDCSKLIQVKEWVEADLIQTTFYNVFDITDLDEAIKYLQDKRALGKCILDVSKLSNKGLMMN
eukprot:TCALIF_07823-PA protein Name:"Similar to RTN4IP1 Reticulon-4-interacting protein 1, mitochondrial (Homo sapiens)" AED:0.16 eAED:0.18 QI:0/0/0/0.25/1/1/4/0/454